LEEVSAFDRLATYAAGEDVVVRVTGPFRDGPDRQVLYVRAFQVVR
jgi:hypothetical protein